MSIEFCASIWSTYFLVSRIRVVVLVRDLFLAGTLKDYTYYGVEICRFLMDVVNCQSDLCQVRLLISLSFYPLFCFCWKDTDKIANQTRKPSHQQGSSLLTTLNHHLEPKSSQSMLYLVRLELLIFVPLRSFVTTAVQLVYVVLACEPNLTNLSLGCMDARHGIPFLLHACVLIAIILGVLRIALIGGIGFNWHFLRQNEHPLTKFLTMENSEVLCRNRFGNAKTNGGQIYNERDSKNKRGKEIIHQNPLEYFTKLKIQAKNRSLYYLCLRQSRYYFNPCSALKSKRALLIHSIWTKAELYWKGGTRPAWLSWLTRLPRRNTNLVLRAGRRGAIEKVGEFAMVFVETPNMSEITWIPDTNRSNKKRRTDSF
ncbi:hypothetical protein OIU78_010900 [Salix suchowensis]|nr:hypothetical protein OIU78_010900 [Salix suchowensis]